MIFADALTLDAPRKLQGGAMAVRARAARTGTYQYTGREVDPDNRHGLRDAAVVNVLRDEAAVFDERAVRSFIGKPVTDDHPREAVTADNWRDHARGTIMGAVRDGDYLAFDLLLTDAPTVAKVDAGKRELSNGYACDVEIGDFTAPDGTKCQARQKPGSIVGNHVALVDRGRAGSECAICDAAPDSILSNLPTLNDGEASVPKLFNLDGYSVDIANVEVAERTITTLRDARDAATTKVSGLETQVATLTTDKATLEAKVTTLEASKPTPQQLRDAARQFAAVVDKAKVHGVSVTDSMGEAEVIKATVLKHLGDDAKAAEGWTDAQFASSFAVLPGAGSGTNVVSLGQPSTTHDGASVRDLIRRNRNAA